MFVFGKRLRLGQRREEADGPDRTTLRRDAGDGNAIRLDPISQPPVSVRLCRRASVCG